MIRVTRRREPANFAAQVRTPGNEWLAAKGHNPSLPLPKGAKPPPYWRRSLPDLHERYQGVCAYLAVHLEVAIGGVTADHYVAKSSRAGLTYEWKNYRLACANMNARKQAFDDVLDPFTLPKDIEVFHLELVSGRVYVNPAIPAPLAAKAETTKRRLNLDSGLNRSLRARHFDDYVCGHISKQYLARLSPFVHAEVLRQGL